MRPRAASEAIIINGSIYDACSPYSGSAHSGSYSRDLSLENSNFAGERKQARFGKRGEARVLSLSGAGDMSGNEKLDQEMPIPPGVEEWVHAAETQYNVET
jgi:hypothetical protein